MRDSVNVAGNRLTTFQLVYPRFIHSELLTHRVFSRNSASSRAVPVKSMLSRIESNPVMPIKWNSANKGMIGGHEVDEKTRRLANKIWLDARDAAMDYSKQLQELGIHKTMPNRLTEPWMWIAVVVTATDWDNFFKLRVSPDAEDHFQHIAAMVKQLYVGNQPDLVLPMCWHTPLVAAHELERYGAIDSVRIATGRAARYSYYPRDDDQQNAEEDIGLHDRLLKSRHLSPFEHCAMALGSSHRVANFSGWVQYRSFVEAA